MRKASLFALVVILLASIAACSGATPTPVKPTPVILFQDNFTDPTSGWSRLDATGGVADYGKDYLHISVITPKTMIMTNPGKAFSGDVSIQVDAHKLDGSDDNYFGVMCHYQNADNYYLFMITNDGYSGIVMRKDGMDTIISPGLKFLPMQGIKKGSAVNHIQVDCIGEQLTLYANGVQVSLAYNDKLTGGDVGLAVRSGNLEGTVDIRFDHFTVYSPTQP
jgi:hypothetical protein